MLVPAQVALQRHSKIFGIINFLQCLAMNSIRCAYGFAFCRYVENLAFQRMEFHEPIILPLLKSIQVMLKISSVRLGFYIPV